MSAASFMTSPLQAFVILLFVGLLGMAVISDLREYRIPNRIPLAIAALFPAWALTPGVEVDFLASTALAAIVLLVGLAIFAAGVMGGGDIKLIAAVSPWMGIVGFPVFLLVMGLTGGVLALFQTSRVRLGIAMVLPAQTQGALRNILLGDDIPYAVAIAAGAVAGLAPGAVEWGLS